MFDFDSSAVRRGIIAAALLASTSSAFAQSPPSPNESPPPPPPAIANRPAHSLAAHRPFGSVMRARLQLYGALSASRHRENGVAEANPARIEDVPA